MTLRRTTPSDKRDWERLVALYIESFPENERRPLESLEHLAANSDIFRADIIETEDGFAGFLTHWDLGKFIYAEHFAMMPTIRGGGIGGKIIDAFVAGCDKPVILEAETATDDLSRRRLGFYVRHGFEIAPQPYAQPAYSPECKPLPMHLLSFGKKLDDKQFEEVRDTIYKTVYNIGRK